MRKWEDIVKDKLEDPDGVLPESVFDEFHSRLEAPADTRKPFPWVWVAIPALAAGLAAILLLREPSAPSGGVQIIPQPTAPVAVVTEDDDETGTTAETGTTVESAGDDAVAGNDNAAGSVSPSSSIATANSAASKDSTDSVGTADNKDDVDAKESADAKDSADSNDPAGDKSGGASDNNGNNGNNGNNVQPIVPDVITPDPQLPAATGKKKLKVGPAAGMISGGGLLAAAVTPLIGSGNTSSGQHGPFMGDPRDKLLEDPVHYFPIRAGLSVGIPIADRWFISTGLNYSLYLSSFNYRIAGKTTQAAHYLGVPVKINWIMASNDLFDVYLGGGVEGDKCMGEDGFSLWLQGAGGIQMNLSPLLGIYLEPELSWRVPTGTPKLETYRSAHPLMFTVSGGLRFNIGKK